MKYGSKPNIVLINGDDWEWGMFPIHNSDTPSDMKDASTGPGLPPNNPIYSQMYPTIRRHMVEDGIYLSRHYAQSVCSPSRKQLLSGRSVWSQVRYAYTSLSPTPISVHDLLCASQGNGDWLPIRPRYSLISDKLKQAGYTNHFVGKWCVLTPQKL
jgi:arylsulfatase A-like enzyme